MTSKFKYNPGDKLGPRNMELICRTTKKKNDNHWKGLFQCEYKECAYWNDCNHVAELEITKVASGKSIRCRSGSRTDKVMKVGDKINHLTLLSYGRRKNHKLMGTFQCDCESKTVFQTIISAVQNGTTKSCGCLQKEAARKNGREATKTAIDKVVDITGQKFGKLIALKPVLDNNVWKWDCLCECDRHTLVPGSYLRSGNTKSCGLCNHKSFGEEKIEAILNTLKIRYKAQKTFEKCVNLKTGRKLFFDFYLPDYNICIEYDGEQHYYAKDNYDYPGWRTQDNLLKTQYRDSIKNQYCKENNIKLIRIPYWDYDKLDEQYLLQKINE